MWRGGGEQTGSAAIRASVETARDRLLASVHDASPCEFSRLRRIDQFLAEVGIGARYALLVVPDFHRRWPLADHPGFVAWLRGRAACGVEIVLHGLWHLDTTPAANRSVESRFRHAVFGEGEFAFLDVAASRRRLEAGRAQIEDAVGSAVTGFVAPAWQYSAGAHAALRELEFDFAESRFALWSPKTGHVASRTPVIATSNRGGLRRASSLAWSNVATRLLADAPIVRHAIHPADFDNPALVAEIRRSLSALLQRRRPASYASVFRMRTG